MLSLLQIYLQKTLIKVGLLTRNAKKNYIIFLIFHEGLPIVPWNGSISTSESNFLLACEVKSFPSIQDLVSLCWYSTFHFLSCTYDFKRFDGAKVFILYHLECFLYILWLDFFQSNYYYTREIIVDCHLNGALWA